MCKTQKRAWSLSLLCALLIDCGLFSWGSSGSFVLMNNPTGLVNRRRVTRLDGLVTCVCVCGLGLNIPAWLSATPKNKKRTCHFLEVCWSQRVANFHWRRGFRIFRCYYSHILIEKFRENATGFFSSRFSSHAKVTIAQVYLCPIRPVFLLPTRNARQKRIGQIQQDIKVYDTFLIRDIFRFFGMIFFFKSSMSWQSVTFSQVVKRSPKSILPTRPPTSFW